MLTDQKKILFLAITGGCIIIALQEFAKGSNNNWIEPLHDKKQKIAEPLDNIKIQNLLLFRYPKLLEKKLTKHIKHIYFVNNNPGTIGKRNLTIPRFGISSSHQSHQMEAIVRTYDLAYFMKSMYNYTYTIRPPS